MARDPGLCLVKWCDEVRDHDGPHIHYAGDMNGIDSVSGAAITLQVVLTGTTRNDRHVELIIANGVLLRLLLTWPQVTWLSSVTHDAVRRWAG